MDIKNTNVFLTQPILLESYMHSTEVHTITPCLLINIFILFMSVPRTLKSLLIEEICLHNLICLALRTIEQCVISVQNGSQFIPLYFLTDYIQNKLGKPISILKKKSPNEPCFSFLNSHLVLQKYFLRIHFIVSKNIF